MFDYIFKEEDSLLKEDKQQLEKLLVPLFSFSYHFTQSYKKEGKLYYSSKPKWRLLVKSNGELIGSLSIVKRHIKEPSGLIVGGIGNVGVKETFQKQGLVTRMLNKSHLFMKKNGINFSLLFCIERLKSVYIKAGYRQIEKSVTFSDENSRINKEELALFFPVLINKEDVTLIQFHGLNIGEGTW